MTRIDADRHGLIEFAIIRVDPCKSVFSAFYFTDPLDTGAPSRQST